MKLLKSQSGFSHYALLMIIILLGGISFAGWRVIHRNPDPYFKGTLNPSTAKLPKVESDLPAGFVEYENKDLGVKFVYPNDWQKVSLTDSDKKYGAILSLVSPNQHQAYVNFAKSGKQTEGPIDSDLYISRWESVNDETLKNGFWGEQKFDNLNDYISNSNFTNSRLKKVGEITVGSQKAYKVLLQGFGQSYGT